MRHTSLFLIISFIIIITFSLRKSKPIIKGYLPVPTEFDIKKSKRKDFKNQRKEYFKKMHRAHPDTDWEKMNKISRKKNTDKVRNIRQNLYSSNNLQFNQKKVENISQNLSGYWQERGSNNLAGRILTADIDWENNLIYCASDGGNIWRGSLTGENWISLNDYMQI